MPEPETDLIALGRSVVETEAAALTALADSLGAAFAETVEAIRTVEGRVVLSGMGKSAHVARKVAATLASTGTPAHFVHGAEASHGDLGMIAPSDLVILFSKSGATVELGDIVRYCTRFEVPLVLVTADADSGIARSCDHVLVLPKAPEACGVTSAPTTSTAMMMALGDALAVALLVSRGFGADDFLTFHPGGRLGAALMRVSDSMHTAGEMPLIGGDASVGDAVVEMSAKGFGCTGVLAADGALAGVITDGDLRRHMNDRLMGLKAVEVMTRSPLTIEPDALLSEALQRMTGGTVRVTALFAVDGGGKPVGIVHIHDCLRAGLI